MENEVEQQTQEAAASSDMPVLDYLHISMHIPDLTQNFINHAISMMAIRAVTRPVLLTPEQLAIEENKVLNIFGEQAKLTLSAFDFFRKIKKPEVKSRDIVGMVVSYNDDEDLLLVSVITPTAESVYAITNVRAAVKTSVANQLRNFSQKMVKQTVGQREALKASILKRMKPQFRTAFSFERNTLAA